jgi:predicted RNA methylase
VRIICLSLALQLLLVWPIPLNAQQQNAGDVEPDIVYVPTPYKVVTAMLEVANVGPDDLLYDLGSGDGRIVIAAARDYGATGVGVEIDPTYVNMAKLNAAAEKVTDKVTIVQADLFEIDFSEATVVSLYLSEALNL